MFHNKLNADIEILVKRLSLVLYVFVEGQIILSSDGSLNTSLLMHCIVLKHQIPLFLLMHCRVLK